MIYVWYYCTERANKMRLVSTKDKLVLFSWRNGRDSPPMESAFWVCDFSFFSLSRKLRMKLSRLLSCVRIQAMKFQGRVQLREWETAREESAQEKPAVWGGIFQSLTNPTQPNHPPKHHLLWDAHINNDFVLFRPACVCVCVSVLKYNTIC